MYKTLQMYSVIAITGFKRSGKDLVAEYISHKYGYTHVKVASKLKSIIKLAFDLNYEDVESSKKDLVNERLGVSPRRLMDFIGTHVFQYELNKIMPHVGRKYWIQDLLHKQSLSNENIVISDLRFHHELEELKKNDSCLILRVNRDICIESSELVSEQEISDLKVDHNLYNNGTIEDLYAQIDHVLTKRNCCIS